MAKGVLIGKERSLRNLMRHLGHPDTGEWRSLASNYLGGWGEGELEFYLDPTAWQPTVELLTAKQQATKQQSEVGVRAHHNGLTLALSNWTYDDARLKAGLVVSDYFTFLAYQAMATHSDPIPLGCSILGANFFVVTQDGYVIITERAASLGPDSGPKPFFSFAETASIDEINDQQVDIVGCAVRGAQEELGLSLARGRFVFTSMGQNLRNGVCSMLGVAYSQTDRDAPLLGEDNWERQGVKVVPFRISEVLQEMQVGVWDYGVQLGLLEALVYQYGMEAVWEAARAHFSTRATLCAPPSKPAPHGHLAGLRPHRVRW